MNKKSMKRRINITRLKKAPEHVQKSKDGLVLCVFSNALPPDIAEWVVDHDLIVFPTTNGNSIYNNILIRNGYDLNEMFYTDSDNIEYLDGFSPNLFKDLHVGHLSNLIHALAYKNILTAMPVSILNDTIYRQDEALMKLKEEDSFAFADKYHMAFISVRNFIMSFSYTTEDKIYKASDIVTQKIENANTYLRPGTGEYEKCFVTSYKMKDEIKEIVCFKQNGHETYFFQDLCFAHFLNAPTLYVTGYEQNEHFKILSTFFPENKHVGLGLVRINNEKMSTRKNNSIGALELLNDLTAQCGGNYELAYNSLAGELFNSHYSEDKNINFENLSEVTKSKGLYLSYACARLVSAGCTEKLIYNFDSTKLQHAFLSARAHLNPNILFAELVKHAQLINNYYEKLNVKENILFYDMLFNDLICGLRILGMHVVKKV